MSETEKQACRLLYECADELRLHDEEYSHVTSTSLKDRLHAFLVKQENRPRGVPMNNLMITVEDIDNLILAVEAWENSPARDGAMGHLLGGILTRSFGRERSDFEEKMAEDDLKIDKAGRERKTVGIMLKAKLLVLRNEIQDSKDKGPGVLP